MSRGHEYIFHCLNIVNSYNLFQPHTPLFQSKPSPNFQTVNYNEGLRIIFPQKEQRKPSKVKIRLLTFPILSAMFSVCSIASHRLPNEWSLTAKLYFRNDQNTHFGVNTWLTQADHKVSKLCCHSAFPHVVPRPKHMRKQWSWNQLCSHPSYRGPDHTTLLQKRKKRKKQWHCYGLREIARHFNYLFTLKKFCPNILSHYSAKNKINFLELPN